MEFETISIDKIKPAPYNPRIMPPAEMQKLKRGLKTYGLVDPIIIDLTDNNTVIGGHQRLEALQELGVENLKLLRLGDIGLLFNETSIKIKDKNDQKSLNLSLNKINGVWDYNLLDNVITDLTQSGYDISLTGFDDDEILLDGDDWDLSSIDNLIYEEQQDTPDAEADNTDNIGGVEAVVESETPIPTNTIICPNCHHEFHP